MKNFWTWFACGAGLLVLVVALRRTPALAEDDPRVKTINDPEMSLLKKDAPGADALDNALTSREEELKKKESELKSWELRLQKQEDTIKAKVEELRNLQEQHAALIEADQKRRKQITGDLVKTYETMNPKKASQVFAIMESDLAADFLMLMKPKKVAAILDVMEGLKAAELSSLIAGRRKPASPAVGENQAQGR
jgi:flagellar motility protein MotE (MotC chaperone)